MSARRPKPGRTLAYGPPEGQGWVWMTTAMLRSITYRSLSIHALRVLDFLRAEHIAHGQRENGNLAATYKQLQVWGVTAADVRTGFDELAVCGFVQTTVQGLRQAGGGEPSRYRLTWLPCGWGVEATAPTHEWIKVVDRINREGVGSVAAAKRWLRGQVASRAGRVGRGPKRSPTSHLQVVSPLRCEASAS